MGMGRLRTQKSQAAQVKGSLIRIKGLSATWSPTHLQFYGLYLQSRGYLQYYCIVGNWGGAGVEGVVFHSRHSWNLYLDSRILTSNLKQGSFGS